MTRGFDHTEDGTTMAVEWRDDGSYYGHNGKWDFTARDWDEVEDKLTRWGYELDPVYNIDRR